VLNSRGVLRTSVLYYLTWILKVEHIGSMTKLDLPAAVLVVLISLCCETGSVAAQQHAGICTDGQNLDAQKESAAAYTISFDYIKKSIIIPICIRGPRGVKTTSDFILDTATNRTILDEGLVRILNLPEVGRGTITAPGGSVLRSLVETELAANGERFTKLVAAVNDLSNYSRAHGRTVGGVLGNDFLKQHVLVIDYSQKQVGFLDTSNTSSNLEHLATIPFTLENGFILIACKLPGGVETNVLFDTGHILDLQIYPDLSAYLDLGQPVSKRQLGGGAGQVHEVVIYKIPWVELAGYRIDDDLTIDVHPLITPNAFTTKLSSNLDYWVRAYWKGIS
jgi:hypothetical protein